MSEEVEDAIEPSGVESPVEGTLDSEWVEDGVDYGDLRAKMEESWSLADKAVTDEMDRVEKVISLLAARRYSLSVNPEDMERASAEAQPDLEPGVVVEGMDAEEEAGPPSIPALAVFETGNASELTLEIADELPDETWTASTERLYDDVLYLFESGDLDGALVSLERLLLLAGRNPEVQEFISLNEEKLIRLYERALGSFDRKPQRERRTEAMPMSFLQRPSVAKVYNAIDGNSSMETLMESGAIPALEVCAVLNQLRRARLISC